MVLVDTMVWIDHFNVGVPRLVEVLEAGRVVSHRWVIGELLLGSGVPPSTLEALRQVDQAPTLPDEVLLEAIDRYGWRGLSWVDLQLVLSAGAGGHALWTRDRAARRAAATLGIPLVET